MNDEYIYTLAQEEFDAFLALLDREPRDNPKLRDLMSRQSPFWED